MLCPPTLFHGDGVRFMAQMADGAEADCLVTDPPYLLTSGGQGEPRAASKNHRSTKASRMSGKFDASNYNNDGKIVDCTLKWSDWLDTAHAALTPDADAYIMSNDKNLIPAGVACLDAGFRVHNILVWEKGNAIPNRWYMKNVEFIIYAFKGRARPINKKSSQQKIRCLLPKDGRHPTEKPVTLMRHYIENSTNPGDIVLDPFMGSGTTGVAAMLAGRNFVGCEQDAAHFAIAEQRITQAFNAASHRE